MIKIIGGVKFDTKTAIKVEEWWNGYGDDDFRFCMETVYRKEDGTYFLVGEGGPLTKYRSQSGNSFGWGEKVIPLSLSMAKKWAEERMDGSDYEAEFGPVPEDNSKVSVCFTLSAEVNKALSDYSKANGKTIHLACDSLLRSALGI